MKRKRDFWNACAGRYDSFTRWNAGAYETMYERIRPDVQHKYVLELAAGTGAISKNIVNAAAQIEVTDQSAEMIEQARKGNLSRKLHFSVQDMFALPYAEQSFDVVIAANVLHIVPTPEKALREMRRVLKNDGRLIVPTFVHGENTGLERVKAFFMRLAGFPLCSRWSEKEYLTFLRENGWRIRSWERFRASFPLCYAVCEKQG